MDLQGFMAAKLTPRQEEVSVPALASFFADGEAPVWVIRGLTGAELGRCREAVENNDRLLTTVKAMLGDGDKAEAVKELVGLPSSQVPEDVARRITMLVAGSVSPELGEANRDVAVKLAQDFPVVFYDLTTRISSLTAMGAEAVKPSPSGKT